MNAAGEPIQGDLYKHDYVGGRVYDPDLYSTQGIFMKKITHEGKDLYLFAEKLFYNEPFYYIRYIPKEYIKKHIGPNKDDMYHDLKRAIDSVEYKHPEHLINTRMSPYVLLKKVEINSLSGKTKAREKIANFMTQAIYSGPIYNEENKEKMIFTGGPMYKRGLASFTKHSAMRKSRKQRGGQGMGQPLKYTDPSYSQPMAEMGRNLLGVVAPITIRPGLEASPMTGGTMAMSPMKFQDAYHSNPMAPTGQPLTFKLPATLNQGLNMGQLGGAKKKSRKSRSKRGGFYPSIMGGVVSNAPLLVPLAARQSMRLLEEYKILGRKTRKNRKNSRRNRKH